MDVSGEPLDVGVYSPMLKSVPSLREINLKEMIRLKCVNRMCIVVNEVGLPIYNVRNVSEYPYLSVLVDTRMLVGQPKAYLTLFFWVGRMSG